MRVLVTGANGFIAKNLIVRLEDMEFDVLRYTRANSRAQLVDLIEDADAIFHLAGANRPPSNTQYLDDNVELSRFIAQALSKKRKKTHLIYTSSKQVAFDNEYGRSKLAAEQLFEDREVISRHMITVYRLPGVFGKWCRPNYNSVIATFCYNKANGLSVEIDEGADEVALVYIDDVVNDFLRVLSGEWLGIRSRNVSNVYQVRLSDVERQLDEFEMGRLNLSLQSVGSGFPRALYATYLSYLPVTKFSYDMVLNEDERGDFVEMLKHPDFGQISAFTIEPNCIRGGHYHHTKNEKFLVMLGDVTFHFRNVLTNECYSLRVSGRVPKTVITVPGWVHSLENMNSKERAVVVVWANEIFDRSTPDTIVAEYGS